MNQTKHKAVFVEKGFNQVFSEQARRMFSSGEEVCIKLHFGEPGNPYALKPAFVKQVVGALKDVGIKPFLFDSPVAYNSPRNSEQGYLRALKEKGYSESEIGCASVISNESIKVKTDNLTYGVCKVPVDADGVIVLTHVKGHICSGFGGSIKNLGMGCQDKETKHIIHSSAEPVYVGGCTLCKECVRSCPTGNIRLDEKEKRPFFDKNWCCGCSNCAYACKFGAIRPKVNYFDTLLAEAAVCAVNHYKKVLFINVMKDMARLCDCVSDPGKKVSEDVGIVISDELAVVDKASYDLINEKNKGDLFKELNKKSPLINIKEAARLLETELDYELVKR